MSGATLVIGGTGDGIGATFVRRMEMHTIDNLFVPSLSQLDVTNRYDLGDYFSKFEFDRIVYCAGIQTLTMLGSGEVAELSSEIFHVNVMGFISMLDAIAVHHNRSRPLSIVAVVSDAARVPMRGSINYCASKAALAMAIRCGARELAPWCRVNGVSPTVVFDTPMTRYIDGEVPRLRGWSVEQTAEYERSMIPMGRRATKNEVATLIYDVLYGPEMLTGSIIEMTGGK